MRIKLRTAQDLGGRALESYHVPPADARTVVRHLIQADLRGHDSHGLVRLPFLLERLAAGLINPHPYVRVFSTAPATALLDGDNGLGPVIGQRGMALAVRMARRQGCGVVAVRRSNHLGALDGYVRGPARGGLVGLAFSNAPPAMAPPGGRIPWLGTNPIAAGFPPTRDPLVLDLSTTQVARGKILNAARAGVPIPEGWAADASGEPTTDAAAALEGTLLPLGGPKGFALGLLVELLTGVLAGAAVGAEVQGTFMASDLPSDVGHCFICIDPGTFGAGFEVRAGRLLSDLRAVPAAAKGAIRLPGDRSRAESVRRRRQGLDIPEETLRELARAAGEPL